MWKQLAFLTLGALAGTTAYAQKAQPNIVEAALSVINVQVSHQSACHAPSQGIALAEKTRLSQLTSGVLDPNEHIGNVSFVDTPLDFAVLADDVPLLQLLVRRGARIDPMHTGQLLEGAATWDSPAMIDALARQGLSMNQRASWPAIAAAALYDRQDNVEALLGNGADINAQTDDSKHISALVVATSCHNQRMVDYLLHHGAKVTPEAEKKAKLNGISL